MLSVILQRHSTWRHAGFAVLLIVSLCHLAVAADNDRKKSKDADLAMRPYRNGPLTAADFRCPPPNPVPKKNGVALSAMTFTSIRYNTNFHWREVKPQTFEARLTKFEAVAQVDRRQSWTTRPTDERLLDHEQGHFDVSELFARRLQKKFDALIAARAILGHGDDKTTAVADLNQQVETQVQEFLDLEQKAQNQYDITTHHGTYHNAQAIERQKQIAALHDKAAPAKNSP